MNGKKFSAGFTLIELLIVVAIIAILAAIAVPNFLEAQVRSKVSRVHSDHRSLATALEAYAVDHNKYPPRLKNFSPQIDDGIDDPRRLTVLSTPVAYIANALLKDPFKAPGSRSSNDNPWLHYIYLDLNSVQKDSWSQKFTNPNAFPLVNGFDLMNNYPGPYRWVLCSYGPDRALQFDNDPNIPNLQRDVTGRIYYPYDTTNGTVSMGDIHRFGP